MTPQQWKIHQEQQLIMLDLLLAAQGVKGHMRKMALDEFEKIDNWDGKS